MPLNIDQIIKETASLDSQSLRIALAKTLSKLGEVLQDKTIEIMPSAYIMNLSVLQETKGVSPDLAILTAMSYAFDSSHDHRQAVHRLLRINHFVLDQRIPTTTH